MVKRKIDHQGRLTIPKELLDKYNIKKDDILDLWDNEGHIAIRKYTPEYYCVITGKITSKGRMIGNSFVSDEGMQLIKESIKDDKTKNHD